MSDQENKGGDEHKMETLPAPSSEYVAKAEARSLDFMNPKRWQVMQVMAQTFLQSGALPATIKNAPQLIMVMQAGYEAGLQPLEAMSAFYFVNGKLSMFGDTAISQVLKAGHKIVWGKCDDLSATVTITRGDDPNVTMSTTYTMEQAKRRGLAAKEVWQKFPENMLKFKAFHATAKFVCPDALHGLPIKEDIEGEVVDEEGKPVGKGKTKKASVTQVETTTTDHKPLDQALSEPLPPKDEAEDDGESPARKAMKKGKKAAGADDAEVKVTPAFTLTGDEEKDRAVKDAIIEDELAGRKPSKEALAFLGAFEGKYGKSGGRRE